MNDAITGKTSAHKTRIKTGTDWEVPWAMSDEEIRAGINADADAQATDVAFWEHAKVVMPQPKQAVIIKTIMVN